MTASMYATSSTCLLRADPSMPSRPRPQHRPWTLLYLQVLASSGPQHALQPSRPGHVTSSTRTHFGPRDHNTDHGVGHFYNQSEDDAAKMPSPRKRIIGRQTRSTASTKRSRKLFGPAHTGRLLHKYIHLYIYRSCSNVAYATGHGTLHISLSLPLSVWLSLCARVRACVNQNSCSVTLF